MRRIAAGLLFCLCFLSSFEARADGGEARSILRDPDRVYHVVAGEADASALVQNPANLGYLQALEGIFDFSLTRSQRARRGDGAGLFLGVPLPWEIAALGIGLQTLWRHEDKEVVDPLRSDATYGKLSLGLGVPLGRWLPGVNLGLGYSRAFSRHNLLADGAQQLDLGFAWRANRFLSLGMAVRGINRARVGVLDNHRVPVELDPELALRPLGLSALELAVGVRSTFVEDVRIPDIPYAFQPHGRVLFGYQGFRVFAEVERYARFADGESGPRPAMRLSAGIRLDFGHLGIAGGPMVTVAGAQESGVDGGTMRLRASKARYEESFVLRSDRAKRLSLGRQSDERSLLGLLRAIEEAERERRSLLLLDLAGMEYDYSQIEEIRAALQRFESGGGQVVAYLRGGSLRHYYLASIADRIYLHPAYNLEATGMVWRSYHLGALLKKLGVEAEFLRAGEHLSGGRWSLEGGTGAKTQALWMEIYTSLWERVIFEIAKARGRAAQQVKAWIDTGPQSPAQCLQDGFVDALVWPDEVETRLAKDWGRRFRFDTFKGKTKEEHWGPMPQVAVLVVEGELSAGESATIEWLNRRVVGQATILEALEGLREDPNVRAVVLRLDSPGGTLAAAESIHRELQRLDAKKPLVVSIGGRATGGGYMLAATGRAIYADAGSTVGEIGVFLPKLDLSGLLRNLGISVDARKRGRRAEAGRWWRTFEGEERAALQSRLDQSYRRIIEDIAQGRGMSTGEVEALAAGRPWSGERAVAVGLVDRIGGLRDAVSHARRLGSLPRGEHQVVVYPAEPNLLERIRAIFALRLPVPWRGGERARMLEGASSALPLQGLLAGLRSVPASLWRLEEAEAMAIAVESRWVSDGR